MSKNDTKPFPMGNENGINFSSRMSKRVDSVQSEF